MGNGLNTPDSRMQPVLQSVSTKCYGKQCPGEIKIAWPPAPVVKLACDICGGNPGIWVDASINPVVVQCPRCDRDVTIPYPTDAETWSQQPVKLASCKCRWEFLLRFRMWN